jgi:hypothetical protein
MAKDRDERCAHEGCRCRLEDSQTGGYCSTGCALGEGCSHVGCTCGIDATAMTRQPAPAGETRD